MTPTLRHRIDDFSLARGRPPAASSDGKRWPADYRVWIATNDTLSDDDRKAIAARITAMPRKPRFSVVMPVHNPPPAHLIAAINSVRLQLYPHWELCIADDGSTDPEVTDLLRAFVERDARIRMVRRPQSGHIARASNDALALAEGDFVALLDHDDLFTEHALYMVAEEINACPDAGIIYSDEDKVDDDNTRFDPYFKQHFNRETLMGKNCINHLGVFRRDLLTAVHGFLPGTEGSQDYDITLRVLERIEDRQVRHVPHVLYHWRATVGSTALDPGAKAYAFEAGKRAIADHFERRGEEACVQHGRLPGLYRVQRQLPPPDVTLIVTGFDPRESAGRRDAAWLRSLTLASRASLGEVLVADATEHGDAASNDDETIEALQGAEGIPLRTVRVPPGTPWPMVANQLGSRAGGDTLIFLTAGLCPIDASALRELALQAQRPEIGAVGGGLQRTDGTIMHDGYVMGLGGVCGSFHDGWPADNPGYFGLLWVARRCAAVSGHAMAMRRDVFEAVRGFDNAFSSGWADVDMCLRLRQRGLAILYTPFASFIAPATVRPTPQDNPDTFRLLHRHRTLARIDPYWNPNFDKQAGALQLAAATAAHKPWRVAQQKAG